MAVGPTLGLHRGLYTAGILALRVILLYYVTTMLMLTTSLVELTNGLELIFGPLQRLRVPVNELVLVFVIAIKFVPSLSRKWSGSLAPRRPAASLLTKAAH